MQLKHEASDMLIFNVENAPGFASDPETGEVFGLMGSPEQDQLWGVYIVNGREYKISIAVEIDGTEPQASAPRPQPRLRFWCSSIHLMLRTLLVDDVAKNTAFVRRVVLAFVEVQRRRPLHGQTATFCSDFSAFKAQVLARKGRIVPFDMPSDEELFALSLTS